MHRAAITAAASGKCRLARSIRTIKRYGVRPMDWPIVKSMDWPRSCTNPVIKSNTRFWSIRMRVPNPYTVIAIALVLFLAAVPVITGDDWGHMVVAMAGNIRAFVGNTLGG